MQFARWDVLCIITSDLVRSTVNLCAVKAFDKMNHDELFIKLMKKLVPINSLRV